MYTHTHTCILHTYLLALQFLVPRDDVSSNSRVRTAHVRRPVGVVKRRRAHLEYARAETKLDPMCAGFEGAGADGSEECWFGMARAGGSEGRREWGHEKKCREGGRKRE